MSEPDRPDGASPDDDFDEAETQAPEKKTASNVGSIETEKVTDFAEDKETTFDEVTLKETFTTLNTDAVAEKVEKEKRMREMDAIRVKESDVHLIRDEMALSDDDAERVLKEHNGDVVAALRALIA